MEIVESGNAGVWDFATTAAEQAGGFAQTVWGGLFETAQTGIETAGETIQAFPRAVGELGPEEVSVAPGVTYAPEGQASMLPLAVAAVSALGVAYWLSAS